MLLKFKYKKKTYLKVNRMFRVAIKTLVEQIKPEQHIIVIMLNIEYAIKLFSRGNKKASLIANSKLS